MKAKIKQRLRAEFLYMRGLTQSEIAARVGVTDQTISRWKKQFDWDEVLREEVQKELEEKFKKENKRGCKRNKRG